MKKNFGNLGKIIVTLLLLQLFAIQFVVAQPAFPGAEGAGAIASGGRDGDLYFVTNLNDSGPGSFREGIDTTPPEGRTILFKVSGYIALTSGGIQINKENITIAGQTAPGDGICIRDYMLYIGERPPRKVGEFLGNNIIMRHIRVRLGKTTQQTDQTDNIWVCNGRDIILDHVSSSWSADEALSASRELENFTLQYTYMFEPCNAEGHGMGSILGGAVTTDYSVHHNIWAHCDSRNPRPSSDAPDPGFDLDLVNNVFYDWGRRIGYNGGDDVLSINYINNYFIAGPSSNNSTIMASAGGSTRIYQSGNLFDGNKNGSVDGTDRGWDGGYGGCTKLSSPLSVPPVTTDSPGDAYLKNLALGGAMPWRRDGVDKRVVDTIIDQTGKVIGRPSDVGGYPPLVSETPPEDFDNDGMPDFWETAMGLDPSNPADRKTKDAAGYTMLEGYLNWLADGHAVCDRNSSVDVNLRELNGGLTILQYTVASGINGTVTLQSDGYTARFTAASDYSGLADFSYSATEPSDGFKFGPIKVGVLITGEGSGQPTLEPGATAIPTPTPTPTPEPTDPIPTLPPGLQTLEAEDAYYSNGVVESDHTGYSGSGYVNSANESGPYIEWTVNVASSTSALCEFRFANGADSRPMQLSVNGSIVNANLDFPNTGAWTTWLTVSDTINLDAGSNAIRITSLASEGAANIDRLDLTVDSPPPPTPTPTPAPSNCGDVNGDGVVDIIDALLISQFYVNLDPNPFIADNADVNGDGFIDIIDALLVAQYYVGLIMSLSC